jgi:UDPglucose--hexose-1-phosphate uridylyltransferase
MPELRKDYLSESYVIIATERAKRPLEFASKKREISPSKTCPFCPKNENMIPGVIEEIKEGSDWIIRAIWNKYKAVKSEGVKSLRTDNEFYTFSDAVGEHEVIVETPIHGFEMEDLSEGHIQKIIRLLIRRINETYKKGSEYVVVFKNRGDEAGASLSHTHHQVVSYNITPTEIRNDIGAVRSYRKRNNACPYCKIISSEKDSDRRIYQDNNFAAFTPYASRFSFEAWILPKRCVHSITELNDDEIKSLAKIMKNILKTLDKLNYPPFNIFYRISGAKDSDYHFRIEIAPRLSKWAGFEYTTGTIINSMTPENAAKFYRGEE